MRTMQAPLDNVTLQNITLPVEDWTNAYAAVQWIQLIMAILSICGSGSIIVYTTFQNLTGTSEVRPLLFLSLADLLLALSWLVGALLFTQPHTSPCACQNLHTVEQIFYMSSFFYTLNYVWVLYRGLKEKYCRRLNGFPAQFPEGTSSFGRITVILSCLLPVLLMVPVFAVSNSDQCFANFSQPYKCLLMHTEALYPASTSSEEPLPCRLIHVYTIAIFLAAFIFTFVAIVVFMGKARSLYCRCISSSGFCGNQQWATLRVLERRMLLYPSAFFFCWGPAIFLAAAILFSPRLLEGGVGVFLYILQAFTSASQGLLNCLVYGWTQRHFRTLKRRGMRDVDTQTPLLRAQKKGYATTSSRVGNT
ncbi:transmembrane protein 116 isoform X1 [Brienomyrus brachyistius]|uniref:transmembrane protein 116 isoform X1 n=2 Tax=Brienomyrus brachyistius TaxID=42636 RepID=UPI0020B2B84A|nr:transmembrane protein 116 isoform X1 [Brienomyrus brachyistius]